MRCLINSLSCIVFMPLKDPEARKQYLKEYYQKNKQNYDSSWDRIKSDPVKHKEYNERRSQQKHGGQSYRNTRQKILEHLGGQCVRCGATEQLEINHRNLKDTELRRLSGKKVSCSPNLTKVRNNEVDVEVLCNDCHKKWSCAQRKAAMNLFASQSLEEQINQTKQFLKD